MNKIIIDAFGGDHSPEEIIIGSIDALQEINDCKLVFVGKQEKIEELKQQKENLEKELEAYNSHINDDEITA